MDCLCSYTDSVRLSETEGATVNLLKRLAMAWAHADMDGVRIHIPFDANISEYGPNHYLYAKGSRSDILSFTAAHCPYRTPDEIRDWMNGNNPTGLRVGIDCSGFVYRLLNEAALASGAAPLTQTLGTDVVHTSPQMLTDVTEPGRATPIRRAQDLLPGDLLRCYNGGHVAVVIAVVTDTAGSVDEVWYAHSGFSGGPRISWIEVQDPEADISDPTTRWHEAAEDPELRDNHFRDEYYEQAIRPHYYLGDRSLTVKVPIRVKVGGTVVSFPLTPYVTAGVSFAPLRPLADTLGASLTWRESDQSVTVQRQGRTLTLQVAAERAWSDGREITLPAVPELVLGRVLFPIRSLSAGLGIPVRWQPSPPTVHVGP